MEGRGPLNINNLGYSTASDLFIGASEPFPWLITRSSKTTSISWGFPTGNSIGHRQAAILTVFLLGVSFLIINHHLD